MAEAATKLPVKTETAATPTPWAPLQNLRQEIDRLFDVFDFGGRRSLFDFAPFGRLEASTMPAVDIADKDKEYEITAELPGIEEKNVEVVLSNGGLVIRGHKDEKKEEKKKDYYLSERRYGSFERYFGIPEGVDSSKIAANFKNGVLTVSLPKTAEAQTPEKKIAIKAA